MVRLTLLAAKTHPQKQGITYREQEVDIQHGSQMEEWFLCDVNPKGQVRVLGAADPSRNVQLRKALQ